MSNTPDPKTTIIKSGTIPIHQAQREAKRWKSQFPNMAFPGEFDFVQSFFIPMTDIKDLFEQYQYLDPTGVRAYIGIKDKDCNGSAPLRLLLVPATLTEDFYDKGPGGDNATVESSVYDFTMPCPDLCATKNPLISV